jgi:DNA-binding LacI/PurR family transcriptional regulator
LLAPQADWGWITETLRAYDQWIAAHAAPRLVVPVAMQDGEESAFAATRQLLAAPDPPDAIFVVASRFIHGVQ